MMKHRVVPPYAEAMLEALRGLGYSTASALADIIDNSISAGATDVKIDFHWGGKQSRISIADNGCGMSNVELEMAMRLGAKNPLDTRSHSDLGRFGMGLKTASFSQCRRLTVSSIRDAACTCLRWDLDEIAANKNSEWLLFEGPALESVEFLAPVNTWAHGTMVLWEQLDRIVTEGYTADNFMDLMDDVERHLAMVFHRLLEGSQPSLRLLINGERVKPWDPFMTGHPAKPWESPIKRIGGAVKVEMQCHVLPHRDKLTPKEYEDAAGPAGWTTQQGFYVYRNQRLLLAGGWLGLGKNRAWNREEAYRLARIRLDISNENDADWKIDIRKSIARPPVSLRKQLTDFAESTRDRARQVFAFRGTPTQARTGKQIEPAWRLDHLRSGVKYRIDENHPVVSSVLEQAGDMRPLIKAMLKVIEETIPVQRIWLDTAENKDVPNTSFAGENTDNVLSIMQVIYEDLTQRKGLSADVAKKILLNTEPFQNFAHVIEQLADKESK